MPSENGAAFALDEARSEHVNLLAQMSARIRALDELWLKANPTDRLLAVQRLVQTGALEKLASAELEARNERVRAYLSRVRADKKKLEQNPSDFDLKHVLFKLELDLQAAEQDRDELIDESGLRGPLYFCGETFLRSEAFGADELPLKSLAEKAKAVEERVGELLRRADRKAVVFTSTDANGDERTLIRLLPALTMSGDGETA
jgi:hypothetical protein